MSVAAHTQSFENKSVITREQSLLIYNSLGEVSNSLSGLKRRAWRILSHDGTVQKRLRRILRQLHLIPSTHLAQHHVRVVCGRRNHAKYLSRLWLYGHNSTELAFHKPLTKCLQIGIDTKLKVASRPRPGVILAVLIAALQPSARITQHYLYSFLASQFFLIRAFDTQFTDIVARLVVVVLVYISLRHLGHITEDLRRTVVMILPDSPSLYIKTGEAEHLFLKRTEILITQMAHEQLLGETRITLLLLYKVHPLVEIVHRDVQRLAKRDRIEPSALLILHHHDVVSRLIINHQLAVAVGNDTTRRVFNLLKESIGVGTLAIIVAHYLQSEQPYDIGDHYNDSHTAYDNTPVIKLKVLHRRLLTFSITSNSTDVTAILPATHSNQ